MRILLAGDYAPDPRLGSSKVYFKLREEFLRLGHECDVMLAPEIGAWPRRAKARWALAPWVAGRSVGRVAPRYDVVDVASAEGAVLGLRRALDHSARHALVSRSHGLEHRNYQRLLDDAAQGLVRKRWHQRILYPVARLSQVALAARLADRLIVLNSADAAFASSRGWLPEDRIDVIAHGVSERFLDHRHDAPGRTPGAVLFCGTWDDVKGVRYLAEAFGILHAAQPAARLTVLGPSVPAERVLADFQPDTRDAVTVIPRTDEDGVMRCYQTHSLLVLPSSYEGFGMVVPEAMSQGLPVVATPTGAALALVHDGVTGLLAPPRNAQALALAMLRILADPRVARQLGEAAREQVRTYTWRHTAERTLEAYARAIAQWREGR